MHRLQPRLLIVLPASAVGGAEMLCRTLIDGLEDDVAITLLTQQAVTDSFADLPAQIAVFDDFGLANPYDYRPANAWRYAKAIATVVAETRPTVIYAVMHAATMFLALASVRYPWRFFGVRRIGSVHGDVGAYLGAMQRSLTVLERSLAALVFNRLQRVVTPSVGVADDLARRFPGARGRLVAIANGVDLDHVRRQAMLPIASSKQGQWVVMAARLNAQKDFSTLLTAFAAVHQSTGARLILLGEGEERPLIEAHIKAAGLQNAVTLEGFVDNPFPWMLLADVVVLSSHFEGFGLVLVEAMALGRPVVATDCPSGPAEIIRDGIDGFLVPVGDAQVLGERLIRLLEDPAAARQMGERARMGADAFSKTAMIEQYRRVLFGG